MKDIEEVLQLTRDYIATNLVTKLGTIDTEKSDGITLRAPYGYEIAERLAIEQIPFVQFIPDTTEVLTAGGNWDDCEHNIIIIAHVVSEQGDTIECSKRAYRMARAIRELILNNRILSGVTGHTGESVMCFFCRRVDYQPMMSDNFTLKQEIWLHCTIKLVEQL